jgi:hypothetical protein
VNTSFLIKKIRKIIDKHAPILIQKVQKPIKKSILGGPIEIKLHFVDVGRTFSLQTQNISQC